MIQLGGAVRTGKQDIVTVIQSIGSKVGVRRERNQDGEVIKSRPNLCVVDGELLPALPVRVIPRSLGRGRNAKQGQNRNQCHSGPPYAAVTVALSLLLTYFVINRQQAHIPI